MNRLLFDVNILLALFDHEHEHHARVRRWLDVQDVRLWATCPITQNGFVRVASQPAYPRAIPTIAAIRALQQMMSDADHEFWPDEISIVDPAIFDAERLTSHRHVTDVYLLALAKARGGALLTLDARISKAAVKGDAGPHLAIVS